MKCTGVFLQSSRQQERELEREGKDDTVVGAAVLPTTTPLALLAPDRAHRKSARASAATMNALLTGGVHFAHDSGNNGGGDASPSGARRARKTTVLAMKVAAKREARAKSVVFNIDNLVPPGALRPPVTHQNESSKLEANKRETELPAASSLSPRSPTVSAPSPWGSDDQHLPAPSPLPSSLRKAPGDSELVSACFSVPVQRTVRSIIHSSNES